MSYAATAQDETEDRYYTQVEAGDVRLFTLDQLDAAFNAGLIHENTYVCLEGDSSWLTLGEVAGLGEEEPAPISAQQPVHYGLAASPSVLPTYQPAHVMLAPSIAPVVNDLSFNDFDADLLSMRPKRKLGKVVASLAVLALGALGFMVVQSGGLRGLKLPTLDKLGGQSAAASLSMSNLDAAKASTKVEAPAAPAPVVEAVRPEPTKVEPIKPSDEPSASAAAPSDKAADRSSEPAPAAKKGEERFSDEMKAALLHKDKKQAAAQKGKKAVRATAVSKRKLATKSAKSAGGFKAGGSAYDPLNGKL